MKITRRRLKRIIKEESAKLRESIAIPYAHLSRTYDWSDAVYELADQWRKQEYDAFDRGDPSMMGMGETAAEAKEMWEAQVDAAAEDLESELMLALRNVTVATMASVTEKLINGEYAAGAPF